MAPDRIYGRIFKSTQPGSSLVLLAGRGRDLALTFATMFYKNALDGKTLGRALATARKQILTEGATWEPTDTTDRLTQRWRRKRENRNAEAFEGDFLT